MTGEHPPDLESLQDSWKLALRADRKAAQTIAAYLKGVELFLRWCGENGHTPVLDRTLVRSWVLDIMDRGAQPATARSRLMALKRFAAWCEEEGEIAVNELIGVRPPKLDSKVVEGLTDDELGRLVKACHGKEFLDLRDEAILRLMAETGLRARELLGLTVDDVDLNRGLVTVRRGKGGKGRISPFGAQTSSAIERYTRRARRTHRLAHTEALWLGGGGQTFAYHGLDVAMKRRAEQAGISGFHLHVLRHTAAQRWLHAGGSEGGLMSIAGWSSRDMIDRYTRATAAGRAATESRSLNLGDI